MPPRMMEHDADPKVVLKEQIGNTDSFEIYNNQILIAVYVRPEKTKSGIFLPDAHRAEDQYQSKVGLVLKKGPAAFEGDDSLWFKDMNIELDDWIVFRPSDGWPITVNGVLCRMLDDTSVRGKIDVPDKIW
jgi:co-chaperonin GroES (HSP10)